ncbi:amino acid transporter [Gonapodya prolifera JEL478]|uniref:Amino acid transporter n=1 Tax=Gonapodya prolifera (strain JEL478) TaxID=1344416 RepID=A0A139A8W3_GONPJ|nr:amino acid transporter [Gonapodya prolifera JEL478]|eukprot:KXS12905.1 amino acid transporter [Gonapodya prolifera JEL478]
MAEAKVMTADEIKLAKLGYRQELNRTHMYSLAVYDAKGMSIGWFIISILTLGNAAAMAEICSTYPTAGGLYYWSAKLGGEKYGPFAAWVNAWFNCVGQLASIATGPPALGAYMWSLIMISYPNLVSTQYITTSIGIATVIIAGVINCISEKVLGAITMFSVGLHVFDFLIMVIWLLAASPSKQSASFVFGEFVDESGWGNPALVFQIGFLLPGITYIGQDASAHVSEETQGSDKAAAQGIFQSVLWTFVFGTGYLLTLLFCIQDIDSVLSAPYPTLIAQLYIDAIGPKPAQFMLFLYWLTLLMCMVSCIASSSRMMYAFSRDGGLPFSKFFHWVHPETKLPLRTIALSTTIACIGAALGYGSPLALAIMSSVSTVAMLVAYTLPTFMRVTVSRTTFKQGPFNLGPFSVPNGVITCIYTAYMFVLLCLPQVIPVTGTTMNYALPLLMFVLIGTIVSWFVSARKWFKGPVNQISLEQLAEIEELEKKAEPA